MSSTKTNRPGDSQSKTICLPSLFGSMTIKDSVDASFHTLPAHLGPHVHLGSVCMDTSSFKLWLLSASACGQNRTRTEHRKHLPLNLHSPETTLHQKREAGSCWWMNASASLIPWKKILHLLHGSSERPSRG